MKSISKDQDGFTSPASFEQAFLEVMKAEQSTSKYFSEYTSKLEKEMQKFNGKVSVGEEAATNSEMTSATKFTKKSSATGKSATRAGSPDYLDEAATMPRDGTLNERDEGFMGD